MVKFELTTWERLVLKGILQNQARNNMSLGEVRTGLAVLDALDLDDDERGQVQLVVDSGGVVTWDTSQEQPWEVEMSKEHAAWFLALALNARGYPMNTNSLVLEDKLKAAQATLKENER